MDICYIINPIAGKGRGKKVVKAIDSYMEDLGIGYSLRYTTKSKEAEYMAKTAADEGFRKIVAVGGDGTLYEVLNGLIGRDVILGVIPTGTGNDFVRTIGIDQDISKALNIIVYGKERYVDCGIANGRYFLNVAGVGFDTEILREVEKLKNHLSGKWAYLAGVFKTLFKYDYKEIEMIIDGKKYRRKILLVAFANGKYYGGGMKISPNSNIIDGYIDICVIDKISKARILKLFPTIFTGEHLKVKEVNTYRGRSIYVNCDTPIAINLDGDLVGTTPLLLEIYPRAIKMMTP